MSVLSISLLHRRPLLRSSEAQCQHRPESHPQAHTRARCRVEKRLGGHIDRRRPTQSLYSRGPVRSTPLAGGADVVSMAALLRAAGGGVPLRACAPEYRSTTKSTGIAVPSCSANTSCSCPSRDTLSRNTPILISVASANLPGSSSKTTSLSLMSSPGGGLNRGYGARPRLCVIGLHQRTRDPLRWP